MDKMTPPPRPPLKETIWTPLLGRGQFEEGGEVCLRGVRSAGGRRHGPRDQHEAVDDGLELGRRRVRVRAEVLDARRRPRRLPRAADGLGHSRPNSSGRPGRRLCGLPHGERAQPSRSVVVLVGRPQGQDRFPRIRGPGRRRDGRRRRQAIVALAARQRSRWRRRLPRERRRRRGAHASPRPIVLHHRSRPIGGERAALRGVDTHDSPVATH